MENFKLDDSMVFRLQNLFRTIDDSFNGLSTAEETENEPTGLDQFEEEMMQ